MTTANPFRRQPASGNRAVDFQRLNRVLRTARLKPAMPGGPQQNILRRRKHELVKAHEEKAEGRRQKAEKMPDTPQRVFILHSCLLHFGKSPALRKIVKKSFSTSANSLPTIEFRATNTRSIGCAKSC